MRKILINDRWSVSNIDDNIYAKQAISEGMLIDLPHTFN